MSVYAENRYKDRADYLKSLAEEYEIPLKRVLTAASMLGEDEDFDGLVAELEDMCGDMEY
jgi:hypothetical protein